MQGTDTGLACNVLNVLLVQEDIPTVTTSAAPPMLYDYRGFPREVSCFSSFYLSFMLIGVLIASISRPNLLV